MVGLNRYTLPEEQGYMQLSEPLPATPEERRATPASIGLAARVDEQARERREMAEAQFKKSQLGLIPAEGEDEKGRRRQFLISQAQKHRVPPQVLAQQIKVEGVGEAVPAKRQITKDIAGYQRDIATGERVFPEAEKPQELGVGDKAEVQSSKILPGGLVQLVRKDGTVDIIPANEANKLIVEEAETRGAELQGLRTGEREVAKSSMKIGIDAFKKLEPIRKNIANMEDAIRLIDKGAQTGAIAKRFPSIKAASVELQNVQDRLGLDVIQNTTFGALSESELDFALGTALPTGLDGPELKDWLVRKRDAQAKLSDYLRESALFLTTPGNTIAMFMNEKRGSTAGDPSTEGDLSAEEQAELNALRKGV